MNKQTLEDYDWRIQETIWETVRSDVRNAVHNSTTTKVWVGANESVLYPVRETVYWSVCDNIQETIR